MVQSSLTFVSTQIVQLRVVYTIIVFRCAGFLFVPILEDGMEDCHNYYMFMIAHFHTGWGGGGC